MLKKRKSTGIICIILAITVLILGALVGLIWLTAPDSEDDLYYSGGLNFGMPDAVLYKLSSDENLGSVYLKSQSYGNFDGKNWDESIQQYDKLLSSKYSATYLTGLALENASQTEHLLKIEPFTNKYVLPYYVSTNPVDGYSNIQTSDIKNEGSASAAYSVYFYKYNSSEGLSQTERVSRFESKYSEFVSENYLTVDEETKKFLDGVIEENNFSASDSDIISKVTTYIRGVASYNLVYDLELDKEANTVIAFMSGEYESGVCRHFASAATLLYRALGIPARYTTGYLTSVYKDTVTSVTALNAHAWVEVYINGIGWIQVEPTPPMRLECPPDNPEPPVQSLGIFKVQSDKNASILLKTKSYCDYIGTGWTENQDMPDMGEAFYLTSRAIEESGYADIQEVEITPLADIYALPYYVSTYGNDTHTQQTSDRVVSGDVSQSYTVQYYNYPDEDVKGSSLGFLSIADTYESSVIPAYLEIDNETLAYMQTVIAKQGWKSTDSNIIEKVCGYLNSNYKLSLKYDKSLDSSENYAVEFLENHEKGSVLHFATAATLLYRALGIPARLTTGYGVNIPANSVSVVTSDNESYWVEVYIEDCGWIAVNVAQVIGPGPGDLEGEEVDIFEIYSDTDEEALYLKHTSYGDYNGKEFEPSYFEFRNYYGEFSAAYIPGLVIEKGSFDIGQININPLTDLYTIPYMLPYYMPAYNYGAVMQDSDVSIQGPTNTSYNAIYLKNKGIADISSDISLASYEQMYRQFAKDYYLGIDEETFRYLYDNIIAPNGFEKISSGLIETVALYIQNSATYDLEYNRELDDQPNVVIAFLDYYQRGVCSHYAMAATLLYRALGIPARYTTGFVTPTKAGEWVTVSTGKAHAWVEVYVDGFGWKQVEVTPGMGSTHEKQEIVIKLNSVEKSYDGKPWNPSVGFTGFEMYQASGYTLVIDPSEAPIEPGKEKIGLDGYTVYDPNGANVTEYFDIKLSTDSGSYTVFIKELYIVSGDIICEYNGYAQTAYYIPGSLLSESNYHVIEGNGSNVLLDDGTIMNYSGYGGSHTHTLIITPTVERTNVGTVSNSYTVTVVDEYGNDVTDWYKLEKYYGKFTVAKKNIIISAGSIVIDYFDYLENYEGDFTYRHIEIIGGQLADGDWIDEEQIQITGSISSPGIVENVLEPTSIVIYNMYGEDVTANYNIMTQNGEIVMEL